MKRMTSEPKRNHHQCVYKSPVVLGEVPIHLRKDYEGFIMFSESDQFAAESGQATQSILDSVCKSLMDEPPETPPGVNVEAVLKAVDDYTDATFQEPKGTNPERHRKVIDIETGDVANARGGVNIIGVLNQDSLSSDSCLAVHLSHEIGDPKRKDSFYMFRVAIRRQHERPIECDRNAGAQQHLHLEDILPEPRLHRL